MTRTLTPADLPEKFNFAVHVVEANAHRASKTAYIDDSGSLTYGELGQRVRRFAPPCAPSVCAGKSVFCC